MSLAGLIVCFVGVIFVGLAQWQYNPLVGLIDENFIKPDAPLASNLRQKIIMVKWAIRTGWTLIALGFLLQVIAGAAATSHRSFDYAKAIGVARSIVPLFVAVLTWQWLILILALSFHRPLRRLFDRIVRIGVGREKGLQILAAFKDTETEVGDVPDVGTPNILERVDAKLIVLRDSAGRERATLGVTDKNAVSFAMSNPDGKDRVRLIAMHNSANLGLLTDSGTRSVMLAGGPEISALRLRGGDGKPVALLWVDSERQFLTIVDAQGNQVFSAPPEA